MIRGEFLCDDSRVRQFIIKPVGTLESYGVGLDRLIGHTSHSRDNRAGIDSTAQESPQLHIADEADADTLEQLFAQPFDPFVFRVRCNRPGRRVPILLGFHTAFLDNHIVAGQEFLYSFE